MVESKKVSNVYFSQKSGEKIDKFANDGRFYKVSISELSGSTGFEKGVLEKNKNK